MMSDLQRLWEELQRAVVRPEDVPGPDSPEAQRVYKAVIAAAERRQKRIRFVRTLVIAVLALALIAAVVVRLVAVSDPTSITCFESADLDANRAVSFPDGVPSVEDCDEHWLDGTLTNPQWPAGVIPPMVVCAGPDNVLWAFPTDQPNTCQTLGLPLPEPIPTDHPVLAIQQALGDRYTWEACVPPARALAEISQIVEDLALEDWTVEMMPGPVDECATVSIDASLSTVFIVSVPPRSR